MLGWYVAKMYNSIVVFCNVVGKTQGDLPGAGEGGEGRKVGRVRKRGRKGGGGLLDLMFRFSCVVVYLFVGNGSWVR